MNTYVWDDQQVVYCAIKSALAANRRSTVGVSAVDEISSQRVDYGRPIMMVLTPEKLKGHYSMMEY